MSISWTILIYIARSRSFKKPRRIVMLKYSTIDKMPKSRTSNKEKLAKLVEKYGKDIFKTDSSILYCLLCEKTVCYDQTTKVN